MFNSLLFLSESSVKYIHESKTSVALFIAANM